MAEIRIRDEYGNEFPVDATARPFWENRAGCQILDPLPAEQASPAAAAASDLPAEPGDSTSPQRGSKKG